MNRIRPETLTLPEDASGTLPRVGRPMHAVVAGGGLAGAAAATILAERGVSVVWVEKEPFLGGRVASWEDRLASDVPFQMERGFHAFFRQYYNLRALMRRVDPELSSLKPMEDYPVLAPGGRSQSFRDLPRSTPLNIVELTRRTPALTLGDLRRVNVRGAVPMLAFDPEATYRKHDDRSADEYLDSLRFPSEARQLLFDVFAHSFFNPEKEMSAAELLMMFHFYFTGNPEGLVFDVLDKPFATALWDPLRQHLEARGVEVRLACAVDRLEATEGRRRWRIVTDDGPIDTDMVVLGLSVPALKGVVSRSPDLDDPGFRATIGSLGVTRPFAVWRLWLDRPTSSDRHPFVGTTALGLLDNISLYHLLEDESARWADEHGGAVVELHAYAVPEGWDEERVREELLAGLHSFYPETAEATVVEERFLMRRDCPAFAPGSHASRPGVTTPFRRLALAGDFVRLPVPSALMERAVISGMVAANHLLAPEGVAPEPIRVVPRRGLFAPWLS